MLLFNDIRIKIVVVILILLSSAYWPTNLPLFAFLLCAFSYLVSLKFSQAKLIQGILLGLIITSSHITYYKEVNKLLYGQGHDITIKGEIQSLIAFKERTSSILVHVRHINTYPVKFYQSPLLRLSIRDFKKSLEKEIPEALFKQGELWEFTVKLRPPIGRHNEVGYKLEDYALAKGIHSYGKITSAVLIDSTASIRSLWFMDTYKHTMNKEFQSLLLALTFGYKGEIDTYEWRVLRNSGLAHLMAISGLHIGFVFAIGWWLGKIARSFLPCRSTVWLPVLIGCLLATFYAWLADFSLPTIRALIGCLLVSLVLILRWKWPKHLLFLWCLLLCLVINPFSALSMSFWLSFSAVSVVLLSLYFYQRFFTNKSRPFMEKLRQVVFIQCGLFVLLAPIQAYFFSGVSFLSPIINLLSVPWVSLLTVPLSLLAVLSGQVNYSISELSWGLANWSLTPIWWLAEKAEHSWFVLSHQTNRIFLIIIGLISARIIFPVKYFFQPFILLLLCSVLIKPEKKWQVDFLDVGHGLSVLLSNQGHTVVYDTGMKWSNGSIAESVIEPILYSRGVKSINGLIISHSDNDHSGGKAYLTDAFTPEWIRTSEIRVNNKYCIKGEQWREGDMLFTAIWPPKSAKRAYNPHSCVVKIKIEQWTFLLTGDIDAISEMLILNQNDFDDVDVFLVPHHGSNSSSTMRWAEEMKGKVAVVSTGRFTPWNLPSKAIKDRYEEKGIKWLDTAQLGQINITSDQDNLVIKGYSLLNHNVWYRKLFGDNLNSE
ncbi:DNA internalization-related competence protein ComEC/Rec2 [Aliivibrio sp. 1S128]|uniref:DNA internalization-related competence protein ComEC/Rec2 n=1 Tax=Aliivibrio sp. 1S128 TaxID=1840085 RepID=UPI0009F721F5|nr:DNA internalization-related competence protein ComEC/Rec2 [Aliivibrio sp. 1S128]